MAVNLSPVAGAAAQFFDNSGNVLTGGKLYTYDAGTTTPAPTYTNSSGVTAHSNPIILNAAGRVPDSGEIWLADSVSYKFVLKDQNDVLIGTYDNLVGINSNFVNFTGKEETQTATQGQTVFTLATLNYQPATNNLLVFVNGSKQISGTNYQETSSTVITFVDGLNVGDIVDFCTATPVNTNVITAADVSYNQGAIGAVNTNVEAKLQESVSVMDFGAVGDGVTDDRPAIESAINSLSSTGGVIYFPTGTYLLNSYSSDTARVSAHAQILPILSNVSLVGQSGAEIVVGDFFDDKNFSVFNGLAAVKTNSVELKNIGFYNLNVSFSGATSIMRTAYRLRVIMRLGWVVNGVVDGCYFYDGDLSNGIASGCEFDIDDVRGNDLKITNNTFKNLVQQNPENIDFTTIYNGASRTIIADNIFEETTDQAAIIGCAVEMHNSFISVDNNTITGYTRGVWFVASNVEVLNPIGQSATNNTAYVTNAFAYIWADTGCAISNINCSNNSIFCAHIVGYSQIYNGTQGLVSSSNPSGTGDVSSAIFSGNIVNIIYTIPAYADTATAMSFERPFSNLQVKGNYFKNVKGGVQFTDNTKDIYNFSLENNIFECTNPVNSYINLTCNNISYSSIFGNVFKFFGTANTTNMDFKVSGVASNCLVQENNYSGVTPTYIDVDFSSGAFPGSNNKYEYYWYGPSLTIPALAANAFGLATMIGTPPTQFATNGSQFQWVGNGDPFEIAISTTTSANTSASVKFLCANKTASPYAGATVTGTIKASLYID